MGAFLPSVQRLHERYFFHRTGAWSLNGKICKICKITHSENRRTTRKATKGLTAADTCMGILLVKSVMVKVMERAGQNYPNLCQVTEQHREGARSPSLLLHLACPGLSCQHRTPRGCPSKQKARGNSFELTVANAVLEGKKGICTCLTRNENISVFVPNILEYCSALIQRRKNIISVRLARPLCGLLCGSRLTWLWAVAIFILDFSETFLVC